MAKKFWIKGAIKHKGALTRKAKAAGQTPMAFAREHTGTAGATGAQSRLALTLQGFHHPGERAAASAARARGR